MPTPSLQRIDDERLIRRALEEGIRCYIASCRARVPATIDEQFCYASLVAKLRGASVTDLLKTAVNPVWSVSVLVGRATAKRLMAPERRLRVLMERRIPLVFETELFRRLRRDIAASLIGQDPKVEAGGLHPLTVYVQQTVEYRAIQKRARQRAELRAEMDRAVGLKCEIFDRVFEERLDGLMQQIVSQADLALQMTIGTVAGVLFAKLSFGAYGVACALYPAIMWRTEGGMAMTLRRWAYDLPSWTRIPELASKTWSPPDQFSADGCWWFALILVAVSATVTLIAGILVVLVTPLARRMGRTRRALNRTLDDLEQSLLTGVSKEWVPMENVLTRVSDGVDPAYALAQVLRRAFS